MQGTREELGVVLKEYSCPSWRVRSTPFRAAFWEL